MSQNPKLTWINRYASNSNEYQWQILQTEGKTLYHRPLGVVETLFDADGRIFEGRADLSALVTLKISGQLNNDQVRAKIYKAWVSLRIQHALLRSKVMLGRDICRRADQKGFLRHFVVERPEHMDVVHKEAQDTIVFLEDYYNFVDVEDFWRHTQNTGRIIDPSVSMSKLFVLPKENIYNRTGTYYLHLLLVMGHEICDGLTVYNWMSHMILLLNSSDEQTRADTPATELSTISCLPLAQETLYPQITGSIARQRWFWALTVILRHVRRPLPAAFHNTLRRSVPRPSGAAVPMPPVYTAVLNYSPESTPPLNSFYVQAELSPMSTQRHHRLCREAGASIGAGSFALAAVVMMELEETRHPHIPEAQRKPFIASFPLDPRAMFAHTAAPDSLMLAFSSGLVLPFLPSRLPLERRFRFLARAAHRQLLVYQKRGQQTRELQAKMNATRVLANNYMMTVERAEELLRNELGPGDTPQGMYPVKPNPTGATHGISSVGSYKFPSMAASASISQAVQQDAEFIAEFVSLRHGVRVRDDEFLVGMGGSRDSLWARVSYDGNAIDEDMVQIWKDKMESLLEVADSVKL